jgi:hypothetical protein
MQTMDKHIHGKGLDKPTCGKKQVSIDAAIHFQLEFKQVGGLMLICAYHICSDEAKHPDCNGSATASW